MGDHPRLPHRVSGWVRGVPEWLSTPDEMIFEAVGLFRER